MQEDWTPVDQALSSWTVTGPLDARYPQPDLCTAAGQHLVGSIKCVGLATRAGLAKVILFLIRRLPSTPSSQAGSVAADMQGLSATLRLSGCRSGPFGGRLRGSWPDVWCLAGCMQGLMSRLATCVVGGRGRSREGWLRVRQVTVLGHPQVVTQCSVRETGG